VIAIVLTYGALAGVSWALDHPEAIGAAIPRMLIHYYRWRIRRLERQIGRSRLAQEER